MNLNKTISSRKGEIYVRIIIKFRVRDSTSEKVVGYIIKLILLLKKTKNTGQNVLLKNAQGHRKVKKMGFRIF